MSGPPPPALSVQGLSVRLGTHTVLHGIDLLARPGELLALTGPNGSGKTTLLRTILGLLPPAEGEVRVLGRPVASLTARERARRLAWVPQEEAPRDDVPIYDYVLYGRYAHLRPFARDAPEDVAAATTALREVGLESRARAGVRSLSGGERQRLLLARALAQEAPVLLLDEPTAHLDIGHQLDLLERVGRLVRERGVLAVAALHDLNLAARYADRIVVLSRGRRVADGPPEAVLEPALLREVWGVEAVLRRDPNTARPYLFPRRTVEAAPARAPGGLGRGPVHVVGGGGAAAPILRRLCDDGWSVTAGALPLLDSDAETAQELGLAYVAELPFAPLSDEVRARHRDLLARARAIVVSPFAIGPSNLGNLEDLLPRDPAVPLFLVGDATIGDRDFTGGRARALWDRLKAEGGTPVRDLDALLAALGGAFSRAS